MLLEMLTVQEGVSFSWLTGFASLRVTRLTENSKVQNLSDQASSRLQKLASDSQAKNDLRTRPKMAPLSRCSKPPKFEFVLTFVAIATLSLLPSIVAHIQPSEFEDSSDIGYPQGSQADLLSDNSKHGPELRHSLNDFSGRSREEGDNAPSLGIASTNEVREEDDLPKTNPLIESAVASVRGPTPVGGSTPEYKSIRGQELSDESFAEFCRAFSSDRCDINKTEAADSVLICASNGQRYQSRCELWRHSCFLGRRLSEMPAVHCRPMNHRQNKRYDRVQKGDHRSGQLHRKRVQYFHQPHHQPRNLVRSHSGSRHDRHVHNNSNGLHIQARHYPTQRHHYWNGKEATTSFMASGVETTTKTGGQKRSGADISTRLCDRAGLARMKRLLLDRFRGNVEDLFRYLDRNGDHLIEANELWPRESQSDKQLDNRGSENGLRLGEVGLQAQRRENIAPSDEPGSDFAFKPLFPSENPCSLSHIMLFDLELSSQRRFDLSSLIKAFSSAEERHEDEDGATVHLALGESRTLTCSVAEIVGSLELASYFSSASEHKMNTVGSLCAWTRNEVDLTSISDAHIALENHQTASGTESSLHLINAQFYLSGHFKCSCQVTGFRPQGKTVEKTFKVHVTSPPDVKLEPKKSWSPIGSRASFDCRYNYIDTRAPDKNSDLSKGDNQFGGLLMVQWLKDGQEIHPDSSPKDTGSINQPEAYQSARSSITLASSRLTIERLEKNDSGRYTCRVKDSIMFGKLGNTKIDVPMVAESEVELRVGEAPTLSSDEARDQSDEWAVTTVPKRVYLWMFHENGISIYKVDEDNGSGQEMDLVREINGHSQVSPEVGGNWNQLTLCGGINPEQVVICEWSSNALHLEAPSSVASDEKKISRRYIYVGQPNLNRVIVMDAHQLELVAIINTEPQPRKLFHFRPNKIHLSKWVRRRMSPVSNGLELESSSATQQKQFQNFGRHATKLTQHDIWLLCYGQPLVVDPSSEGGGEEDLLRQNFITNISKAAAVQPFTPRLSWPSIIWSDGAGTGREARLRNRKSAHIIQSTFLAPTSKSPHSRPSADEEGASVEDTSDLETATTSSISLLVTSNEQSDAVRDFKRSTVLTTHHIFASKTSGAPLDLIQDLYVPDWGAARLNSKIHYAYATHYDEPKLFRIAMDEYHYDREINLKNCDPLSMLSSAHGLLIVQCRTVITHEPLGQLVLDELTSAHLQFNPNIRVGQAHLSRLTPDHRYLVTVDTKLENGQNFSLDSASDVASQPKSIILVQELQVSVGLRLRYEIKTQLELHECSFAWRDGYYAAIFLSTSSGQSDSEVQHTEVLSLRLGDGRLELLARVPGLPPRPGKGHNSALFVNEETKLAVLSTTEGTFLVDLEENRVSQSLRRHQAPPTLLWVS